VDDTRAGYWPGSFLAMGGASNGVIARPVRARSGGDFWTDLQNAGVGGGTASDGVLGPGVGGTSTSQGIQDRTRAMNAEQAQLEQSRITGVSQGIGGLLQQTGGAIQNQQNQDAQTARARILQQIAADQQAAETQRAQIAAAAGFNPNTQTGVYRDTAATPATTTTASTKWLGIPVWVWGLGAAAVVAYFFWSMQPKGRRGGRYR
jgi:hypothetical protein